ncbi:MAG: 4Fe-4S binding protein [Clostridiaceae bacterium]|nr:4Fe-4S binding protein [Clostridiaceae bacterium]
MIFLEKYYHSVTLDVDKCKGCTNCLKQCPTQAIRVRDGKAKIIKERCIDCGVCISVCPYHAKKAITDSLSELDKFEYKVALPAPALYGQFPKVNDINKILNALLGIGFDDCFEVAKGAEVVTNRTKELIKSGELMDITISSACPAVLRLISVRFPNLLNNVLPIKPPIEVAAYMARQEAVKKTGLSEDKIGLFFITPCPAKATSIKNPLSVAKSGIDGVISIKDVYLKLAHKINSDSPPKNLQSAGFYGVSWANVGGEAEALEEGKYIAVDGIHNVINILEAVENEKLDDISFIEALACPGGCVGGPLTVENNYVAKSRIKETAKKLPKTKFSEDVDYNVLWEKPMEYNPIMNLDEDIFTAIQKASEIDKIYKGLPGLDCGSCGSPSCKCLAEDIVRNMASETDCIFKLREKVKTLSNEMNTLSKNLKG